MTKKYVLMKTGWDYNDEIRFRPDGGGGMPHKVFDAEAKADDACDALNVKALKELFASGEITEYFYGWDELLPYESRRNPEHRTKLDKACEKVFGLDFEALSNHFEGREGNHAGLKTATDKDWLEFLSCIKLNFWEVVTVEKG